MDVARALPLAVVCVAEEPEVATTVVVATLRHEHDALRRGDFRVLLTDDERNVFAFARTLGEEALVVALNRSDQAHSLRVPVPSVGPYALAFATTDGPARVQEDEAALLLEIPARTGVVLSRGR